MQFSIKLLTIFIFFNMHVPILQIPKTARSVSLEFHGHTHTHKQLRTAWPERWTTKNLSVHCSEATYNWFNVGKSFLGAVEEKFLWWSAPALAYNFLSLLWLFNSGKKALSKFIINLGKAIFYLEGKVCRKKMPIGENCAKIPAEQNEKLPFSLKTFCNNSSSILLYISFSCLKLLTAW